MIRNIQISRIFYPLKVRPYYTNYEKEIKYFFLIKERYLLFTKMQKIRFDHMFMQDSFLVDHTNVDVREDISQDQIWFDYIAQDYSV